MITTDIFWITNFTKGRLGTSARPRGGEWLEDEIRGWHDSGVQIVVSALTDLEMTELDLVDEAKICQKYGIEFYQFAIEDRSLPLSSSQWITFINKLNTQFQSGKSIIAHC